MLGLSIVLRTKGWKPKQYEQYEAKNNMMLSLTLVKKVGFHHSLPKPVIIIHIKMTLSLQETPNYDNKRGLKTKLLCERERTD